MMTYENYKSWQYIESFLRKKQHTSQIREGFERWRYSDEEDFPAGVSLFESEGEGGRPSKIELPIFLKRLKTALKKRTCF